MTFHSAKEEKKFRKLYCVLVFYLNLDFIRNLKINFVFNKYINK